MFTNHKANRFTFRASSKTHNITNEQGGVEQWWGCSLLLYKIKRPQALDFRYPQGNGNVAAGLIQHINHVSYLVTILCRSIEALLETIQQPTKAGVT
jgi:hypothetical protein